jgi:hypothetical protein
MNVPEEGTNFIDNGAMKKVANGSRLARRPDIRGKVVGAISVLRKENSQGGYEEYTGYCSLR